MLVQCCLHAPAGSIDTRVSDEWRRALECTLRNEFSLEQSSMPEFSSPARRPVLLVPGIGNSGPDHWQSRWEVQGESYQRVQQRDWDNPVCSEWVESLEAAARHAGSRAVIAAHSLGCLLVAHWLASTSLEVSGALLVAVPDPSGPSFPKQASGFSPVPRRPLACPSIVVASEDDPYGSVAFAKQCADSWGSRFVGIGSAGHINAASGLGDWSEGHRLLRDLIENSGVDAC